MKRTIIWILITLFCLLTFVSCSNQSASETTAVAIDKPSALPTPQAGTIPTGSEIVATTAQKTGGQNNVAEISKAIVTSAESSRESQPVTQPSSIIGNSDEEIKRIIVEAMTTFKAEVKLNVAGREWKYGVENDLKNLYYATLSQQPQFKYCYDLTATVSEGQAICKLSYMPYKTGAFLNPPAGSHIIKDLHGAEVMAQSMNKAVEKLQIAIIDPTLEVDDIQRALGQAGYGWISYTLSRDGTEIVATPSLGLTLQDCSERINESFRLAGDIVKEIITDGMTPEEKVKAVYSYITQNVAYDFRYYSNKAEMPHESTVALGALKDKLAICGGYSHALETLLDRCGIENYTVSGTSKGETHSWNYVILNGQSFYCDPTADRGGMSRHFLMTEEELIQKGTYQWNLGFYPKLRK